jgi:hypothetical protein
MTVKGDGKKYWPFGAGLEEDSELRITIKNYNPEKKAWENSRTIGPLSVSLPFAFHYVLVLIKGTRSKTSSNHPIPRKFLSRL